MNKEDCIWWDWVKIRPNIEVHACSFNYFRWCKQHCDNCPDCAPSPLKETIDDTPDFKMGYLVYREKYRILKLIQRKTQLDPQQLTLLKQLETALEVENVKS